MSEPVRLRYTNQIVGAFVLIMVALLLAFGVYLVRAKELFQAVRTFELSMEQGKLDGLRTGTEVLFLGQRAGQIVGMEYRVMPQGEPLVTLRVSIKESFITRITPGSALAIKRKFGVGEPYLEIQRPRGDAPSVAADQLFGPVVAEVDRLEQLSNEIVAVRRTFEAVQQQALPAIKQIESTAASTQSLVETKANPALQQITTMAGTVTQSVQSVEQDTRELVASVQQTTQNVDQQVTRAAQSFEAASQDLQSAIHSAQQVLDQDAKRTFQSIQATSDSVRANTDKISPQAMRALKQIENTARTLQESVEDSRDIIDALRGEAAEFPGTTRKFNDTVASLGETSEAINRHWLLRRYSPARDATARLSPASMR